MGIFPVTHYLFCVYCCAVQILWRIVSVTTVHTIVSAVTTGSIPDGIVGIFCWHDPTSHTVALESTQPITEMGTRNISLGVKVASVWG